VEGVPAHGTGVGTRQSLRSLPTENNLSFHEEKAMNINNVFLFSSSSHFNVKPTQVKIMES